MSIFLFRLSHEKVGKHVETRQFFSMPQMNGWKLKMDYNSYASKWTLSHPKACSKWRIKMIHFSFRAIQTELILLMIFMFNVHRRQWNYAKCVFREMCAHLSGSNKIESTHNVCLCVWMCVRTWADTKYIFNIKIMLTLHFSILCRYVRGDKYFQIWTCKLARTCFLLLNPKIPFHTQFRPEGK